MKTALILTENQTHFLQENRQDPITGDDFSIGDEIVFCAECKSAFLRESWEYMGSEHCNQRKTLSQFPTSKTIVVKKPSLNPNISESLEMLGFKEVSYEWRIVSVAVDLITCYLAGGMIELLCSGILDFKMPQYYPALFLFIIRDIIFQNGSLGKKWFDIHFMDNQTHQAPSWKKMIIAILIWCTQTLITVYLITKYKSSTVTILLIVVFILYQLHIVIYNKSLVDRLLKIQLIAKK